MELIVFYLVLALIPAIVAGRKGRSAAGFFLFAVFLTPILALIVALIIDGRTTVPDYQAYRCGWCQKPLDPSWRQKCKHCNSKFSEFPPVPPTALSRPAV